jgi:hypothetical protein
MYFFLVKTTVEGEKKKGTKKKENLFFVNKYNLRNKDRSPTESKRKKERGWF